MYLNLLLVLILGAVVVGNIFVSNSLVASEIKISKLQNEFNNSTGQAFIETTSSSDMNMLLSYVRENGMIENIGHDTLSTSSGFVVVGFAD